jgi:hypothetical protein
VLLLLQPQQIATPNAFHLSPSSLNLKMRVRVAMAPYPHLSPLIRRPMLTHDHEQMV